MAKPFPFVLISPTGVVFDGEASLVVARGTEGEIGILADHAPYDTALKPSVLRADVTENGAPARLELAISSGFLQALPKKVSVLVDEAVAAKAVNSDAVRAERKAALDRQAAAGHDRTAIAREQELIDFADAKLTLLGL